LEIADKQRNVMFGCLQVKVGRKYFSKSGLL